MARPSYDRSERYGYKVERRTAIVPVATPVNTYVRPADPSPSNLHQLAQALGQLDRSLQGWLSERDAKQKEVDRIRGEAAAWAGATEGQAEGVRTGVIPSHQSPAFVGGFKETQGRLAGLKLEQQFETAYLSWDGKDSGDPAAFDKFFADWAATNLKDQSDVDVLKGLLPHIRRIHAQGYQRWQQDLNRITYGNRVQTTGAMFAQAADRHSLDGLTNPNGTDVEALWQDLMAERNKAIMEGVRAEDVDKQFIDVITVKALERRDPAILKLLDRKVPGQEYSYSDSPYGLGKKAKTEESLANMVRQSQEADRKAQERADKQAKDEITRTVMDLIHENPNNPIPEDLLTAGTKVDPEFRDRVLKWQKTRIGADATEVPSAVLDVYRDVLAGGGTDAVRRAMDRGVIKSRETFNSLWTFATNAGKETVKDVLQGQTVTAIQGAIRERTKPDKFEAMFNPDGWSDAGIQAWTDYQRLLVDWRMKNPNASLSEVLKAQTDIGKMILGNIQSEQRTYQRPGLAEEVLSPQQRPAQQPQPQQQPQQQAPLPRPRPISNEGQQWFNQLTPEQKAKLEQRAEQNRTTLEQQVEAAYRAFQQRQTQQPQPQPQAPQPQDPERRSELTLPDGTKVDLASLPPQTATAIEEAIARLVPQGQQRMAYQAEGNVKDIVNRVIQVESSGRPTVKASTSSASGLGQFVTGTWLRSVRKYRPDLLEGRTKAEVLALRNDPKVMVEVLTRFTEDNIKALGPKATPALVYLAHFGGLGVAKKIARATDMDAPASEFFSSAAIKANKSILAGKTIGQVLRWAERKMSKQAKQDWVAHYG